MEDFDLELDEKGWFGLSDKNLINKNAALIIIDMENFAVKREWGIVGTESSGTSIDEGKDYYYGRIENIVIPNLQKILAFYRRNKLNIIHIRLASLYRNWDDVPKLWRIQLKKMQRESKSEKKYDVYYKSEAVQFINELKPLEEEIEVIKNTGNSWTSTNLDFILKNKGINSLIVGGVWGNSCLEDTVRIGADLGYLITLLEDAVCSPDERFHDSAIRVLRALYCDVRNTNEVINLLQERLKV